MTWYFFIKKHDPDLLDYECEKLLWENTSYPFGDVKKICKQILAAIRAEKNNVKRCEFCLNKLPHHSTGCVRK